ncbi:MAG: ABC transporter permease [Planctomycetota bacterium]
MSDDSHAEALALASHDSSEQEVVYRVRPWSELPLSVPINLSWTLWALVTLCLWPIAYLPAWVWLQSAGWAAVNIAATTFAMKTRKVRLERSTEPSPDEVVQGTSLWRDAFRRLRGNQFATVSFGLLLILVVLCFGQQILFEWWRPAIPSDSDSFFNLHVDHTRINKEETYAPPSVRHWFGTDSLGRDLFARTLYGGRISFLVALVGTAVSLVIGVSWGAIAGYYGGRTDQYMMRFVDVLYGLPFMFLVILILTLVNGLQATASKNRDAIAEIDALKAKGKMKEAEELTTKQEITPEIRTAVFLADNVSPIYTMFFALGLVSWLTMARIARGQVLSLKQREFVVAARAVGAGNLRIIFRHIVPNLLGPVIVYTTLTIPSVMLAEAFLSFLGLGISQPECSWGSLSSEGLAGVNVIKPFWWLVAYPAGAISIALFSLNFIGDGLRDALDPRSKP